jgi:hypothetical protein
MPRYGRLTTVPRKCTGSPWNGVGNGLESADQRLDDKPLKTRNSPKVTITMVNSGARSTGRMITM